MQYCGCNPGLRVYQATTLPTKLHSQPSLLLFLFLLLFLLYTSGFSAPSSGQTLLAQTKHLFIGTGHFSVSYTSESPSEAGPPCGVGLSSGHLAWVNAPHSRAPASSELGLARSRADSIQKAGLSQNPSPILTHRTSLCASISVQKRPRLPQPRETTDFLLGVC